MHGAAVESGQAAAVIGYYGKVPTHGDFVQRRLPRSFIDPWDSWLQRAIAISREQLAEAWLDNYLHSPIWRFVLPAGLCGEHGAAGVLMPSVDSVGRYYPMTIAALLPGPANQLGIAAAGGAWFASAEDMALSCLEDGFMLKVFEERLDSLGAVPGASEDGMARLETLPASPNGGLGWTINGGSAEQLCPGIYPKLLDGFVRERFRRYTLWWTSGSHHIPSTLRLSEGLPAESDFAHFLCGTS